MGANGGEAIKAFLDHIVLNSQVERLERFIKRLLTPD